MKNEESRDKGAREEAMCHRIEVAPQGTPLGCMLCPEIWYQLGKKIKKKKRSRCIFGRAGEKIFTLI